MLLTFKQLGEREGKSAQVVGNWHRKNEMPVVKIGGRLYVDEAAFEEWKKEKTIVIKEKKIQIPDVPEASRKKSKISGKMKPLPVHL